MMNAGNKKPTIIMVGPSVHVMGGISSVIRALLESRPLSAYRVVFVASHRDGSRIAKLLTLVSAVFRFVGLSIQSRPAICHLHSASRASFLRKSIFVLMAKAFGMKVIFHVHGAEFKIFYHEESGPLKKSLIRFILRSTHGIIALSESWKRDLESITGDGKKITVISNPAPAGVPKASYRIENETKILFMGRLSRRKGVYDLLEAFRGYDLAARRIRLLLCGDGDIRQVLEDAGKRGWQNQVEVPGWVTRKEEYFRRADIFALPSYNEGLPMSVLEAAAYGLPIVSTPVGGVPEVIQDGLNGYLVSPGDIMGLRARLEELIASESLRQRLGTLAFKTVRESFGTERIASKIAQLYDKFTR